MSKLLKRFLSLTLAILMVVSYIPTNAFADQVETTDPCEHNYQSVVTAPTCTAEGYTTYTCACGDTYTADKVAALGHSYNAVVTAPTCTAEGYTTYTCACGDTYTADKVAALGHTPAGEGTVTAPTCTAAGYTVNTCSVCGVEYTYDEVEATGHNYVDGTCSLCGTTDPDKGISLTSEGDTEEQSDDVIDTEAELTAALAAALAESGTVTLGGDIKVTEMIEIPVDETVTLDLNGKAITVGYQSGSTDRHIYPFDVYGNMTIKDTAGDGSITGRGIYVQNGSELTVDGGAIYGIDSNGGSALFQYGGDIVINGGHIEQKAEGTYNFAIHAAAGTVTVNGGWVGGNHGAIAAGGAVVVIKDGDFVCTGTAGMTDNVLYTDGTGSITINGGTFTADNDGPAGGCCVYDANGGATINGGTFGNSSGGDVWGKKGGTVINGGTFADLRETSHVTVGATIVNGGKTYTMTADGLEEYVAPVAKVNGTEYTDIQEALNAAAAGTGNVTVDILSDINLTDVDWTPVTVSAPGYPLVTVNGNNKKITGLNDMLFAGTWAGGSGLIINDLTIKDSTIVHDKDDTKGTVGVGAFIGYPQASATITLNNCHLVNSHVEGGHWTGGLIGISGGYSGNDGPVFMNLTIADCSITGSTITGKGSAGGVIGHAANDAWTNVVIEDTTVSDNAVISTGSSTNKAGAVMGTIGAAGQPATNTSGTKTGGVSVSATVSGNTVTSNGTAITTVYGRQGSNTGMLEITGGTYDNYPIEENVSYAAPAEGHKIEKNADNTYGLVEQDPAEGKVAQIGSVYYETLAEAIANAVDGDTITLLADVTENVTITQKADLDLVIDGDSKTFTGIMTVFGDARYDGAETLTIKNINFVAAAGADSCIVSPDRTAQTPARYSYSHNVTVSGCTFTDPDGTVNCAAIRQNDGGDRNWTVEKCSVDNTMHSLLQVNNVEGKLTVSGCIVKSKNGLNLNSTTNVELTGNNIDVNGYALRAGVSSGGNLGVAKNFVLKNNTLKSACNDDDAVIMLRASAVDMGLSMEMNVVSGTTHISGTTADTKVSANANYWDGYNAPVVTGTPVEVDTYYTDEALSNLKEIVKGLQGEGTEASPYLINNLDELVWFRNKVDELAQDGSTQFAGKYFKLTADIDLADINWNPIGTMSGDHGSFKGIFDGDGHTISNLNVQQAGNGLGLFARTAGNAEIKNLTLHNVTVKSTDNSNYVGGLVGNAYASTKITNVHVTGNIDISGRGYIGGISGHGYVVMDNVSVKGTGTISSTFWCAGGILGYGGEGATNIMNAYVEGITITSAAGGLGAIVGMAEDNNGTQPISGSNLSAKNVEIKTYTGAYGDSYANYALGYLYGGNPTSKLTGELSIQNVKVETSTGEAPTIVDAAASIGDKVYFNLQSAVNAVEGDAQIDLLRDVTEEIQIPDNKSVLINLGGNTLNGCFKPFEGKLTVKDGSIVNTNADYSAIEINAGELNLENVNISSARHGVRIDGVVTATINGGEYKLNATSGTRHAVNISGGANVTIKDGTFVGPKGTTMDSGSAVCVQANTTATIEGGNFSGGKNATLGVSGTMTVKGGTFDQDPEAYVPVGFVSEKDGDVYKVREIKDLIIVVSPVATMSTTTITVATMDEAVAYAQANAHDSVIYQITGPVELTTGSAHGIVDLGTNVTIEGVSADAKLTIVGGGVPDIKGVTFKNLIIADEGTYLPNANEFMYQNFIDCTFINCTFEEGIRVSGDTTLTDCTINSSKVDQYALWSDGGKVTMIGSTVIVDGEGYGMVKSDNVTEYTLTGNTFQYKNDANKEALNTNGATINASGNTFIDCSKGIIPADKTNYAADGTTVLTAEVIEANNNVVNYAAKIGQKGYETVAAAFAAAQDGDEVKILTAGTYKVPTGKNITITGAVEGVKFDMSQAVGINASMTFNAVTFEYGNANYVGLQHAGDMEYNNCTFNGQVFLYGTSETFNNCTFNQISSDAYNVWTYGAKEVKFNECTFNSAGKSVLIYSEQSDLVNDVTVTKSTFNASAAVDGKAAIEMDSSLTSGINLTIDGDTTATGFGTGNVSGSNLWNNKKGNNTDANNDIKVTVGDTVVLAPVTFAAKIGDTGYTSIADAIKAAEAGDTITLLTDITEDVTVNKSLTIDGANFKYTGNISVSGTSTAATVKNVNFVNGTGYAITTNRINSITVENCTVSSYGYGFLYANKSTPTIMVKNVEVNGGNYGLRWGYGTNATLENVTMTNVNYGIWNQNFGTRTITVKNSIITRINVEEKGTATATFKFEGANTVSELSASQYAKYEMNVAGATLTAPAGATVTTNVDDSRVVYKDGAYKVEVNPAAQIGTTEYTTLQAAIEAAETDDTVILLKDLNLTEADCVANADRKVLFDVVDKDITLDMNGKQISVVHEDAFTDDDYLVAVIRVADGAGLTVTGNGTIDVKVLEENADIAYMFWMRGTTGHLTIENGTYHMNDSADSMVYTNGNEIVNINGGTWTLDTVGTRTNGAPWIFNAQGTGGMSILINGGTFNADINRQHWSDEAVVSENCYVVENADGTYTVKDGAKAYVSTGMLTGPYFKPKDVGYATFEEALKAAIDHEDGPITLLADTGAFNVPANATITLDLNGHTVSSDVSTITVEGGDLTVKDSSTEGTGKIVTTATSEDYEAIAVKQYGKLTLESGTVESGLNGIYAYSSGGHVVMNGGTVKARYMAFAVGAGSLSITGGTVLDANYPTYDWGFGLITITGGTFTNKPDAAHIAYGYGAVKTTIDGVEYYVVQEIDHVAKIGEAGYYTLAKAIEAAVDDDTVEVVADFIHDGDLKIDKDITVAAADNVIVNINGQLQITADGVTVKGIDVFNASGTAGYINAKDVLIEDCEIAGANGFYQSYTTGTVTFEDSYIGGGVYGIHFDGSAGGEIVIDNCEVTGWTSFAASIDKITVTDTEFAEHETYNYIRFYQDAEISGCTFNEKMAIDIAVDEVDVKVDNSTVTNGTVEGLFSGEDIINNVITVDGTRLTREAMIGDTYYKTLDEAFVAAQPGDEVEILAAGTYALSTSGKNITITGAVDGVVFDNIGAKNMGGANVTFKNVTFDYYPNVNYTGLQHSGNLVYNDCTINGQVFLYGESETFNNCTFNQNSADAYNVWTYGAKEVAFNECTFNCVGKSVLIYAENASITNEVTVTDSTFNASASVDGKAAIEMDSSLTAGIELTITNSTATGFANGNVSGNSLWNNKKDNTTDANNDITVVVDNVTVLEPVTFVAKIGETGYTSIDDAIAAAQAGDIVSIYAGEYTGDLNINKAITVIGETDEEGNNLVTVNGKLSISGQKVTVKNLNVSNTSGNACQIQGGNILLENCDITGSNGLRYCYANGGDVTLKNCDIVGGTYGVHFDGGSGTGNVIIDGGSITGWTSFGGEVEEITISGTVFKDGNYNQLRFYQNATLTNVEFNPDMSVDFGKNEVKASFTDCSVTDDSALTDIIYLPDIPNMGVEVTIDNEPVVVVAMIGDDQAFLTLQEAINAAASGDTVTVIADITLTDTVTVAADDVIILDLNGKTISQTKACTDGYSMITNNGSLTITGNGKISFTDNGAGDPSFKWGSYTINNRGTLVVENGTIEHLGTQTFATHCIQAIFNYSGSTTINGGTISTPNYRSIRLWHGDLTINGGTIDGQVWVQTQGGVPATLTINGGSFSPNGGDSSSVYVTNDNNSVTMSVTGGTFETKIGCYDATTLAGDKISGGTFGAPVPEALCAEGYIPTENADGTYGVKVGKYVAQIGEKKYETFKQAYAEAVTGDTIILLEPLTIAAGETTTWTKNVTITYTADVAGEAMITNSGTLTVSGTNIVYTYTGAPDTSYGKGNYTIFNKGTLNVISGSVKNETTAMSHAYYAIHTDAGATLNVSGGTIENVTGHAIRQASFGTGANNVTISGGKIVGTRGIQVQLPGGAAAAAPEMTLNISGGEIASNEERYNLAVYVYSNGQSAENFKMNITGGTFNGNVALNGDATDSMAVNAAAVSGGIFNGAYGIFSYSEAEEATTKIAITGGTFATNDCETYAEDDGYEFVQNEDGTYSVEKKAVVGSIRIRSAALNLLDKVAIIYKTSDDLITTNEELVAERGILLFDSAEKAAAKDISQAHETILLTWSEADQRYVGQSEGIDARDMGDSDFAVAYLKLTDGTYIFGTKTSGEDQVIEYSPLIYCKNKQNDATVGTLCSAMMHYGAAAQADQYHMSSGFMNEGFAAVPFDEKVLGESVFAADTTVISGMQLRSGTMDLKGEISYIIKYTVEDSIANKKLYAEYTLRGVTKSVELTSENDDRLWAVISGNPAKDMDDTLSVKPYYLDESGEKVYGGELVYSAYEYTRRAMTNENFEDTTIELAKALAMYIYFADIYSRT